jgi:hypothetical protein
VIEVSGHKASLPSSHAFWGLSIFYCPGNLPDPPRSRKLSHGDVTWGPNFILVMFKVKSDVNFGASSRKTCFSGETTMNSVHRSILARLLMTGAALAAVVMASAVRAETVVVQGDDGAAGADGESVTASAGSVNPIT